MVFKDLLLLLIIGLALNGCSVTHADSTHTEYSSTQVTSNNDTIESTIIKSESIKNSTIINVSLSNIEIIIPIKTKIENKFEIELYQSHLIFFGIKQKDPSVKTAEFKAEK